MPITEELFKAFLNCETKCFLRFIGAEGTQREYLDWQQQLLNDYKQKCSSQLRSNTQENECLIGPSAPQDLNNNKYRLLIDCVVQTAGTRSHIHALERSPSVRSTRYHSYIPIRFVPNEKITRHDKLLLAFDALSLSMASGDVPLFGRIIHGSERKMVKIGLAGLMKTTRSIVDRIAIQQVNNELPELILNKHCDECEFKARCRQISTEKDDLSLLSSMTEKERKTHRGKGVFSVTQLSYTLRSRRKSKRWATSLEKHSHSLKALALREHKIHIAGQPKLNITGSPVYLDVEGVPDRDFYYLIGLRIPNAPSHVQYSFWANDMSEERQIWTSFLHTLLNIDNPQLIHYGAYETIFLKRMKERYGYIAKDSTFIDAFSAESINILSLIYAQIYFPTYSNGLKEIAQYLGFHWSDTAASGLRALLLRSGTLTMPAAFCYKNRSC